MCVCVCVSTAAAGNFFLPLLYLPCNADITCICIKLSSNVLRVCFSFSNVVMCVGHVETIVNSCMQSSSPAIDRIIPLTGHLS